MTDLAQLTATIPQAMVRASTTRRGITVAGRDLQERRLPYTAAVDAAARCASALKSRGVDAGDRVCILGPTTPELVVTLFGTWWAGAVPVVLSLPRRQSDLDALVADVRARCDHVEAKVLAVANMLLELAPLPDFATTVASIESLTTGCETPSSEPDVSPHDLGFLQFTSGTTARPRAVALTHQHLVANMTAAATMAGIDGDRDVFVSWLPLFHDMGLIGMILAPVIVGADTVLIPTEEFLGRPGIWVDAISKYRGTVSAAPNFGYGLAARDLERKPRPLDLSSWRIAANGAEPIDVDTCDNFVRAASSYGFDARAMCPMFGLAEATLAVSLARSDEPIHTDQVDRDVLEMEGVARPATGERTRTLVACGHPLPGHDLQIKAPDGRTLPDGHVGEICFRGPSVMLGYWNDPDATAQTLRDGWLHTGDLGYVGPNGLVVCGRRKDMIILGGRNVYAEDYELFAERVPGVRKGNVIAFAIAEIERMVVVAETTAEPSEASRVAEEALAVLRRALPRGPQEVVLVPPGTLPKTTSGKRQRGICRERYASGELEALAVAR